nr:PQ-loop repeat-containing protein [Armatimonas sp.]
MSWPIFLGLLATWLVEGSYAPQLWRIYQRKQAGDFSLLFLILNITGRCAGLAAALLQNSPVFVGFFVVGITVRGILLLQVLYYHRREKSLAHA